jgi:hypothetical protein
MRARNACSCCDNFLKMSTAWRWLRRGTDPHRPSDVAWRPPCSRQACGGDPKCVVRETVDETRGCSGSYSLLARPRTYSTPMERPAPPSRQSQRVIGGPALSVSEERCQSYRHCPSGLRIYSIRESRCPGHWIAASMHWSNAPGDRISSTSLARQNTAIGWPGARRDAEIKLRDHGRNAPVRSTSTWD